MKVEETSILKSIPILVGFSNILFSLALLLHLPFLNFLLNLLICRDTSLIFFPLEGLMLKLKLPILWPPDAKNWLIGKDPDSGKDWRQEEKGTVEDEMVGWHHWLDAHGLEQASGVGDGQGSLACCSPWGLKQSDMTRWPNWTEIWTSSFNPNSSTGQQISLTHTHTELFSLCLSILLSILKFDFPKSYLVI